MDKEEDVNSSDFEFEETPATNSNLFAQAGKASIEAIINNAVQDRYNSKKISKQLTFVKGSKKTQYINNLWYRRMQAFREHTLKVNNTEAPNGLQIERFLTSIVSLVTPKSLEIPSYMWLQQGVGHLVKACVFYFPSFSLSRHETQRIATTIDYLWQEGRLTKEPKFERNWVGVFLVRKLAVGVLEDGLKRGTVSWDVTLAKTLSIVMVAALASRAGDVTVAPLEDQKLPYLCYKDVVIKLVGGNAVENLVAEVVIRNEKGYKTDARKNRYVTLRCLQDAKDNPLCPIKLVLILALRLGNVQAKSIDELLLNAASRRDKMVQWIKEDRPLFCAFVATNSHLLLDKPAGNHQLTQNISQAGLKAGLLAPLHAHDLRRGSAADTANLDAKVKGVATEAVAAVLGQSETTYLSGVTRQYVGSLRDDVWTKRVNENFEETFGIEAADAPFPKRQRQLTKHEITDLCNNEGLDPKDPAARKKAGAEYRKKEIADWMRKERDRPAVPPSSGSSGKILTELTASQINSYSVSGGYPESSTTQRAAVSLNDDGDDEEIPIDPQLLASSKNLGDLLTGSTDNTMTAVVEEACFDQMQNPSPATSEIGLTPVEFVRFFSKINVTCNQRLVPAHRKQIDLPFLERYKGNSRDDPTFFLYSCGNAKFECPYKSSSRVYLKEHEDTCKYTSIEAVVELKKKKKFQCVRDGCQSSFARVSQLNLHIKEIHDWKPKACDREGCDPKLIYPSRSKFEKHRVLEHSAFKPSRCLVRDCTSTHTFNRAQRYRHHIQTVHKIFGKDIDQYMPGGKKMPYVARRCPMSGCRSTQTFLASGKLAKHLKDVHGLEDDEIEAHIDRSRKAK